MIPAQAGVFGHMEALQLKHMAEYIAHPFSITGGTSRSSLQTPSPPFIKVPAACAAVPAR